MVDCRPSAGAPPHELAHAQPNGTQPDNHHNQQAGGSGDMGGHGMTSPSSVRASTPATTNTLTTYNTSAAPYVCGVKSVLWCGGAPAMPPMPPMPPLPPLPPGVSPHAYKSVQPNGSDLPMNDIPTLRYFYNLGVECTWAAYGAPPHPHHQPPPPRHYSPRDLAQDMQQISLQERPMMNHNSGEQNHKHKQGQNNDKPQMNNQGKGNGQRPLLGPRFKRGGNQEGNQNTNHNMNKHNNNMGNKGPNNRRNSHSDARAQFAGDALVLEQAPVLTLPYLPYPPPVYPVQYYPVDTDPAMMGMMGGMGYVGYDEGVEYPPAPYYAPPAHYPPPHHHPPPPHLQHLQEHK